MRNPLRSEAEAFRFLIVVIVGAVIIGVAAWLNMWLGVAAALLVLGAIVWSMRAPVSAEPAQVVVSGTPSGTHRVLVLAASGTPSLPTDLDGATDAIVVVPALASKLEAATGAVDDIRAAAQATADALAGGLNGAGTAAKGEVGADDPVLAVDDALRTFGADQIVLVGFDGDLAAKVRERFALPVSTLPVSAV